MILPILCYGSEVWGTHYVDVIEKVQIKFCKYFLGLPGTAANAATLGECGRLPLMVYYIMPCIKYWTKLLSMETERYPRQCYLMLYRLDQAGRITWVSGVKDMLFKYAVGFVWLSQEIGNADLFLQQFMQRLKDSALQQWNTDITQNSKLSSYREYKTMLNVERYITDLKQWILIEML